MKCTQCERLRADHKRLEQTYRLASLNMSAAATNTDQGQFMLLKTLADEARIDLELAESEMMQHRDRHGQAR